jgi:CHAT domain
MNDTALSDVPAAPGGALPADEFLRSVVDGLTGLHGELLVLMRDVELAEQPRDDSAEMGIMLDPGPRQRETSVTLHQRYRVWFERVRPFLDRSPTAPTDVFDALFGTLSSYFALRRIGSGITHPVWRELFELESTRLMRYQLALLDEAKECFALLNPRPPKRLEDLAIRFAPLGGQRYLVFADSLRGDADGEMTLPFDARDVENFVLRHCDPLRGAVRGWAPPSVQPYANFGGSLFAALFTGTIRDLYMQHVAAMAAGEVGLRIRLRVAATPELGILPWEYLYDGMDFLALTGAVTVTRHVDADRPVRPLRVEGPLRIAVTVSAPTDRAPIDATKEVDSLKAAIAPLVSAGLVRIDIAPNGTVATLAAMLRAADIAGNPFHVWHFIGHGRYLEREGATYLTFESANGMPQMQSGFELGTLLSAHPALRIAILNACEGARAAPEDSLTSVGAALVTRGLPAAVAMQFSITDAAAIRFADDFYRTLAEGGSIDAAVGDARRSIFFMPNESEWATPVIMARSGDGVLFDMRRSQS